MLTRRELVVSGTAAGLLLAGGPARAQAKMSVFAMIEQQTGGRLGVAAIDTANGHRLLYRADERFGLCSTFKIPLAAAILAQVDAGKLSLDQPVRFAEADLLDYAPVVKANVAKGSLTVGELAEAAVKVSDNAAANLLLPLVAGPGGLTRWLRIHGDTITRVDRPEPSVNNANPPDDERDTTTPLAMMGLLDDILIGDILGPASRERLIGWMQSSMTGLTLLRAGLPTDWRAGDKSGRDGKRFVNNVAIAFPPKRKPVLIACYLDAPEARESVAGQAHAQVAKLVSRVFV